MLMMSALCLGIRSRRRSAGAMMLKLFCPLPRDWPSQATRKGGIGPLTSERRGDDADDVGPLPDYWAPRRRSARACGLGPSQVKRRGDDTDDVGTVRCGPLFRRTAGAMMLMMLALA